MAGGPALELPKMLVDNFPDGQVFVVLENNRSAFLLPVRLISQTLVHQRQQWREWWESVGSNTAQKSSPGSLNIIVSL